MKNKIIILLVIMLALTGCSKAPSENISDKPLPDTQEVVYTSSIEKGECILCSDHKESLLPIYVGQNNLGIICINTFDVSPVEINRYDDHGNLIEEAAGYMSTTHNGFGEGEMTTSTSVHPDRGYADVHVGFTTDKNVDKDAIESSLCQDCLTTIMEKSWDEPYGVGVINFETLEVRLFEENITAFTFGDYYIDIDRRKNKDNSEWTELDLLIFYCPLRYE